MWFISLFFFCLWFFSFMHAGSFPAVAARSRADCASTLALSLLPAIARSAVFLSCWGSCLPAFPPDVPPFRWLWKPVPSSVQWVLPVLPRTASHLVHLHPVNSSRLLPAASFPWALQAGFQQFATDFACSSERLFSTMSWTFSFWTLSWTLFASPVWLFFFNKLENLKVTATESDFATVTTPNTFYKFLHNCPFLSYRPLSAYFWLFFVFPKSPPAFPVLPLCSLWVAWFVTSVYSYKCPI